MVFRPAAGTEVVRQTSAISGSAATTEVSTADAFWVVRPGHAEIRRERLPVPGPEDVQVAARHSAVSRGTEVLVFEGRVPASENRRMRAPFQAGEFPGPVKYGYASVGRVLSGPAALIGRDVFCLHPHQSAYVVPSTAVFPVPEGVPASRAVLGANMETALNAVWDGRIKPGDRVSIVGAGVVGCLVAHLAGRMPGAEVELVDVDERKAATASALGVAFALATGARGEADVVVHASATAAGLSTALALAGPEATVLELSWYGDRRIEAELGAVFHSRRLTLRCSQVGELPVEQRPRWDHRRRLELALRLLDDPRLDALFTGTCALHELPAVMARLAGPGFALCQRVDY